MQNNNNKIRDFFLKNLADPVLVYTVIVMMSIMNYYRSELVIPYGIATLVISFFVFRLLDHMEKSQRGRMIPKDHGLGALGYLVLILTFFFVVKNVIETGEKDYPLIFGVWFLTPQDAVDYNKYYTLAIFLLFLIFMMSVIFYFTRVRYRIFMSFLIFIIPFAIYGKENEKMPTVYVIALSVGFILLMVYFRQMRDTQETEIVHRPEIWKTVAAYTLIFAAAAALVPKPEIEADRTALETMINAEQFTDRLVSMLNVFRDEMNNEQFLNTDSNVPLYYARAYEPMRLKTTTFSTYNYSTDSWSIERPDQHFRTKWDKTPVDMGVAGGLTQAIIKAAAADSSFAEKYGLESVADGTVTIPEIRYMSILSVNWDAQFAPVPQFAHQLKNTTYGETLAVVESGLLYAAGRNDKSFAYDESFDFEYYADTFFLNDYNRKVTDILSDVDNYDELLTDAADVLYNDWDSKALLENEYNDYTDYYDILTEYGDNEKIRKLADKITKGCVSDYDKANAIVSYFLDEGYVYDPDFRKESGDNAVDFLFKSKTGVCYEYATAMVLLARAEGIPARFCTGYNMSQTTQNERLSANFMVTGNDAHGFPELYIKGFGWVSFEPTVPYDGPPKKSTATDLMKRAGIVLLVMALLFMAAILLYPVVYHRIFIMRCRRKQPDDAVRAVMRRICRIYRIEGANTSREAAAAVFAASGADMSSLADSFDRNVYGGIALSETDKENAVSTYISAYEKLKESKKKRRSKKKLASR